MGIVLVRHLKHPVENHVKKSRLYLAPYAIAFQLQALSLGVTCVAGVVSVIDKSDNAIHSDKKFNNIKP